MKDPLVSIVLTSYNQPELLELAFQSLINQTYKNIEIIIVDDCSVNPLNRELILKYHVAYPDKVRYILHEKNNGIATNKNSGFRAAKGEFITYLDGDDTYFEEKIAKEILLFKKEPDLDVVYTNFIFAKPSGEITATWGNDNMPEGIIFEKIVKEAFPGKILFRCELVRREVYERLDFYDEKIKIYHDWDFRIRFGVSSRVGYLNYISNVYSRTDESITIKSSLTRILDEKLLVINKNRKLIESNKNLLGFVEKFKKEVYLAKLFDTTIPLKHHVALVATTLFTYPFNFLTILKSFRHYQLFKQK